MEYIRNTTQFKILEPTVLTLGKFDGLHMGHKYLLEHLFTEKEQGLKTVIFTFDMQPSEKVLQKKMKVLTTIPEKESVFEKSGIDYLIECPFTDEIRNMEPDTFIRSLVKDLNVKSIVTGSDFHFGHNRTGDYHTLMRLQDELGYQMHVVDKVQFQGQDISSTRIREEIEIGNIKLANQLLGYPFFIQGIVEAGNQIGRTIQVPTANLFPAEDKLLPPFGVYVSKVNIKGKRYNGITNIGTKPTIAGDNPISVETNIFHYQGNLYGQNIQISLLDFLREERQFESVEDLKLQIQDDVEEAQKFLNGNK